jgi:hypothetical protein
LVKQRQQFISHLHRALQGQASKLRTACSKANLSILPLLLLILLICLLLLLLLKQKPLLLLLLLRCQPLLALLLQQTLLLPLLLLLLTLHVLPEEDVDDAVGITCKTKQRPHHTSTQVVSAKLL